MRKAHTNSIQGCAFAISVNLFFAGVLTIFFPRYAAGVQANTKDLPPESLPADCDPSINGKLDPPGTLFLFCGLTFVAWVLVYFLVEETRELSLESLSSVFSNHKRDFVELKYRRLVWLLRRYVLRSTTEPPPEMRHTPVKDAEKAPPVPGPPARPVSVCTGDSDDVFS